jgi:O-antigen ligase
VLEEGIRRWMPQSLVEWVWWPVFVLCAFLPSTRTPILQIEGLLLTLTDLVLAALAIVSLPFLIVNRKRYHRSFRWTFLPFTALAVYAVTTTFVLEDFRRYDFLYLIFPMAMAWVAMAVGFTLVSSTKPERLKHLAYRLSAAATVIVVVYAPVGFLRPLGLRALADTDPDFGIVRLSGPLAGPTSLPAFLIISVSFLLLGIKRIQDSPFPMVLATVLTAGLFLCGSRAGGVALLLFAVVIALRGLSLRARLAVLVTTFLAGAIVFQVALPQRYMRFEDNFRKMTYETGFYAWTASPRAVVLGQGYGQVWPWYMKDAHIREEGRWYQYIVETGFGRSVYHPHSLYVNIMAETGLVGFTLLVMALASQLWRVFRSPMAFQIGSRLAPGIIASLAISAFDLMLLKAFAISAVWWVFFFIMAADVSMQAKSAARQPSAPANSRPGQQVRVGDLRGGHFRPRPA